MDLLFKRYADPFSLLNGFIKTSRFCEFIIGFAEQTKDDNRWEFFLHKVWGKTYDEFCEELHTTQAVQTMSQEQIETTVKESMNILGNFNPNKKVGEV